MKGEAKAEGSVFPVGFKEETRPGARTESSVASPYRELPTGTCDFRQKGGGLGNFPLDFRGLACYVETSLRLEAFKSSPERLERERWTN